MPESIQDPVFQRISAHRQQIATGSLVSGGGAAVMGLADFGEPATAGPAPEETREKVTRSTCTLGSYPFVRGQDGGPGGQLAVLHQIPQLVINNTEVRDALDYPVGFRVLTAPGAYRCVDP